MDSRRNTLTGIPCHHPGPAALHDARPAAWVRTAIVFFALAAPVFSLAQGLTPAVVLTSGSNPAELGQSVTFTATVTGGGGPASGQVVFFDGASQLGFCGMVPISADTAMCIAGNLSGGSHSVTAAYSGDATYAGATSPPISQVVNPATPSASLFLAVGNNPSSLGDSLTFSASIDGVPGFTPGGTATFLDNASPVTGCISLSVISGQAQCVFAGLAGGAHSITVEYAGDANYYPMNSGALSHTVNKAIPSIALGSSSNPSAPPQAVTFTASVNGIPAFSTTGSVAFTDGAVTIAGCGAVSVAAGSAQCSVPTLTAGAHTITATYSGDMNYSSAFATTLQSVATLNAFVTLTPSPYPFAPGQAVTFTATLQGAPSAPSPTGTVAFRDGVTALPGCAAVALSSATAQCPASLAAGPHDITATYSGDANYNSTNRTNTFRTLTVAKRGDGSGTVTSAPAGLNCGATCALHYFQNTRVTLFAAPAPGSVFGGWGGNCSGTALSCTLTLEPGQNVTATFMPLAIASAISAGGHACALTSSGGVRCWGFNFYGELGNGTTTESSLPVPVAGLATGVVAVSAGMTHSCALTGAGAVFCWGNNGRGQLGNGLTINSSTPVAVTGLASGVASIAAGNNHTCALTSAGAVRCWGWNIDGRLGNGTFIDSSMPVTVTGMGSGIIALTAGDGHSCAVSAGGAVQCWGGNATGALGNGTTTGSPVPVPVTGLASGVIAVSAGSQHSCAVTTAGAIRCWGGYPFFQLGDGTASGSLSPVAVTGFSGTAVAVSAGYTHTCALSSAGAVQCWGSNSYGELGNGNSTGLSFAVPVVGLQVNAIGVSAGFYLGCAITSAGAAQCWGHNQNGNLGNGDALPGTDHAAPVHVAGLGVTVEGISAGSLHSCAVTNEGSAQCWGRSDEGELGNTFLTGDQSAPVQVLGLTGGAIAVSASGAGHSCALTSAGAVKCWGNNSVGQTGTPAGANVGAPVQVSGLAGDIVAIDTGLFHSCAIASAGAVRCWGLNSEGQLGNGQLTQSSTPVPVTGLDFGVIAIAAGAVHTCALDNVGTVKCWGKNDMGQLGNGAALPGARQSTPVTVTGLPAGSTIAIAAGAFFTCALAGDGTVRCWGKNDSGQLGNGAALPAPNISTPAPVQGITDAVAITAGDGHACARTGTGTVRCWGYNGNGELGDGAVLPGTNRSTPAPVTGFGAPIGATGALAVSTGGNHTCAISSGGTAACWGANPYGNLGTGAALPGATQSSPVFLPALARAHLLTVTSPPGTPSPNLQVGVGSVTSITATLRPAYAAVLSTFTPDRCSLSGSTVTFLAQGLCFVQVGHAGEAGEADPAPTVTVKFFVGPAGITLLAVQSRKKHGNGAGNIGDRDLPLNAIAAIDGAISFEPRAIGSGHRIVFQFDSPVTSVASVSAVNANGTPDGTVTASYSGNELVVTLTGVPDNYRMTVAAMGVNNSIPVSASIGFLAGDVTSNGRVNAADIAAIKANLGKPLNDFTCRFDLNADGSITAADLSAVKARSATVIR